MITKRIKGTNIELSESIHFSVDKVILALEKYVDSTDTSTLADIEVGRTTNHHKTGDVFRAEINFHSRLGSIYAEAEMGDLHAALSAVKDEVVEALRSKKSKKVSFVRRNAVKLKNMLKGLPWRRGK